VLDDSYNMRVPPVTQGKGNSFYPAEVAISITLFKIVSMEEVQHSINFQFEIKLQWRENRAVFHNLKQNTALNALSQQDTEVLWLPLAIYVNTDQQETTGLGASWQWSTSVTITREEKDPERSGREVVDEIEIFQGENNTLSMYQTYTHQFQCKYHLHRYPFDTQVCSAINQILSIFISLRTAP
jgi:hypothetical protein